MAKIGDFFFPAPSRPSGFYCALAPPRRSLGEDDSLRRGSTENIFYWLEVEEAGFHIRGPVRPLDGGVG